MVRPLGMNYTSKQEKELCAKGGGMGIGPARAGYRPVGTIRDVLVGVVDTEKLFHCSRQEINEEGRERVRRD